MGNNLEAIQGFLKQCERVLRVSTKPDLEEYWMVSRVTGIGILIIGIIGFVITLVTQLVFY